MGGFRKFSEDLGRGPLYLATLLFLGALAIPAIWINRRIGRGEKVLLTVLGAGQTLAAVALLVGFLFWMFWLVREALAG